MSSSSRRKKQHGGGGVGKAATSAAADEVIPFSDNSLLAGKENSMPITRLRAATQKRSLRQTAQIGEPEPVSASAAESEVEAPRVRKGTTSSLPRGRISNPSEYSISLPDRRRSSRVLAGKSQRSVNHNAQETMDNNCSTEQGRSRDLEIGEGISQENKKSGLVMEDNGEVGTSLDNSDKENKVSVDLKKKGETLEELDGSYSENAKKKIRIGSCSKDSSTKATVARGNSGDRCSSMLREKLTILEDKVKRIASEIQLTKDMLAMQNLDASEMILSNIHNRIAGIEQAMGCVRHDGDEMGSVKSDVNDHKEAELDVVNAMNLLKKSDEVEAQISPHDTLYDENDEIVQEVDNLLASIVSEKDDFDSMLMADEKLNDFDDQEEVSEQGEEFEAINPNRLKDIGGKSSTAGWFVSEGESVILAHVDGSCSYYDIVNNELKAEYNPPVGISPDTWRDCWTINAPGRDGCSEKYLVAASAGNSVNPGFCSWDFYTKTVKAFHINDETTPVRSALTLLPNDPIYRKSSVASAEYRQWWYKPCGPLIVSVAACQRMVQIYDIRDGDQLVKWDLSKPVVSMDYSSSLHWKSKGKVVIAETDAISLWDVSGPSSRALQSVFTSGQRVSALHVNNVDAEQDGGVRKRISGPQTEGNDGIFCTPTSINILDFRKPSGIALKIPKSRLNSTQSVFSYGDSIYVGSSINSTSVGKHSPSQIQLFSLRKHKLLTTYEFPESNAHQSFTALTQVWGNSSHVMGICGLGLFVFNSSAPQGVKEVIGPDNMYSPSFDYVGSRVLLVSADRPACWRYMS